MGDKRPLSELLYGLSSLYKDGKYSDLTIVCGDTTYRAHKAVICGRSEFFAKACDGPFQEAVTGVINLSDDDPQAVKMMMDYFYHLDYPHVPLFEPGAAEASASSANMDETHKKQAFRPTTFSSLLDDMEIEPTFLIRRASPRCVGLDASAQAKDCNLIIHAKVYALAEQYAVEGLKVVALGKFRDEARVHWASEDFLQAAELVYTSTPEHDRGLRDVIRNTFNEHRTGLMDRENVKRYLRDVPDLAYDVLMRLYRADVVNNLKADFPNCGLPRGGQSYYY